METAKKIAKYFDCGENFINIKRLNSGRINATYRIETEKGKFTLQKINKYVFREPEKVMHNILLVTEHIKNKIEKSGGDAQREVLNVVLTTDKKPYFLDENEDYWRMYKFVDGAHTFDMSSDREEIYNAGFGFGNFQKMLADFDAEKLYDTIPNFHNSIKRLEDFKKAVEEDEMGRKDGAKEEIDFILAHEETLSRLILLQKAGKMPTRVTHNDTKVNNVLIDDASQKAICVIDLDTVMPGLAVYDFGDGAKFISNTATEEETDMSKVSIDLDKYKWFAEGFLAAAGDGLADIEIENMSLGAIAIATEQALRFLEDHLKGDKYFKVSYEGQNLVRSRCQITLVKSMEENYDKMVEIINNCKR